jgi:tRNA A-37 threonylcarbamoyl transferase component Bud32
MMPSGAAVTDALLADRYRLVERIAVGGMGEVWRGVDTLLGRGVAVKTLKAEYLDDPDFRARFRAEARHAGRLAHPGIASIYDFGESADSAWLVMELVEGEPLSGLLGRAGPLSVDRTLDVVAQAAAALQAAHSGGVVHRDVKPGNLLVRADGVLKVTDFGVASATDAVPLTQTGTVVGTASYLSPEQACGQSGSPASDIYALGVVAYECLTGSRPFPGTNPVAVALAHVRDAPPPLPPSVPAQVRELVARALAKDPGQRFPDADDLCRRARELRAQLDEDACYPSGDGGGLAGLPVLPPSAARDPAAAGEPTAPTDLTRVIDWPGGKARSSRKAVRLAAVLLGVLALGLGIRAGGAEPDGAVSASTEQQVPSAAPSSPPLLVDTSAYVGRPAVEVRDELAELGLVPRLAYDGSGTPVGTVSSVEPPGPVAPGTAVLLHVVPEPPPVQVAPEPVEPAPDRAGQKGPPPGQGSDKGNGRGRGNR